MPMIGFFALAEVPKAQAFGISEGDKPEMDCGLAGIGPGLFGSCVPIQVAADPNRGWRNVLKNIATGVLYGFSTSMGQWMAQEINNKLKIRDYYGYNRSLKDMVYRYRIIFGKYLDPQTRMLADITYDSVTRGGANYNQISNILWAQSRNNFNTTRYPLDPANPNFYSNLALAGQWGSSPYDMYHIASDQAFTNRSEAAESAAAEIAAGEGYKSTRDTTFLNNVSAPKTPPFYGAGSPITPTSGMIQTPGAYAAKAVQVAIQRLLNRDYLNTNVTTAASTEVATWVFFRMLNGGLFGGQTATPGNVTAGETFYQNPDARTNTSDSGTNPDANPMPPCDMSTGNPMILDAHTTGVACNPVYLRSCDINPVNGMFTGSSVDPGCTPAPAAGGALPPLPACTIDSDGDGTLDSYIDPATGAQSAACNP